MTDWVVCVAGDAPSAMSPLPSARNDAIAVHDMVAGNWACGPEEAVLLVGAEATTSACTAVLNHVLVRMSAPHDRVFLYFSGHVAPQVRGVTGSFVTCDFSVPHRRMGVNLRSLRHLVEDSAASYIFVVVDGCTSGVVAQGPAAGTAHWFHFATGQMDSPISTKVFLTAASSGEDTFQRADSRYSDITGLILEVSEAALREGRDVTAIGLFEEVARRAKAAGFSTPILSGVVAGSTALLEGHRGRLQGTVLQRQSTLAFSHPTWLPDLLGCAKADDRGDACAFVQDLNWPNGSSFPAGSEIVKSWRIRNAGRVHWRNRFLRMVGETRAAARIHGPRLMPLPDVAPGDEVDVHVTLRMPPYGGSVYAEFKMVDALERLCFPNNRGLNVSFDVVERG